MGTIPTCSFNLNTVPPVPDNIAVDATLASGGSQRIPKDSTHASGWDYTDATYKTIQIYGPTCDNIMNGTIKSVQAVFGCKGIPIP